MLRRSIYLDDPFELTIEEKVFRAAKITCVVFAGAALTLSTLDLMNVKSVESASEFLHNHSVADIPHALRVQLTDVAFAEPSPYATVEIPRGNIAFAPVAPALPMRRAAAALPAAGLSETTPPVTPSHNANMRAALERDLSPVDALSNAPYQDAVDVALEAPPTTVAMKPPQTILAKVTSSVATPGAASASTAGLVKLASLNATELLPAGPLTAPPAPPPISLPSVIRVLPRPAPPMSPAQRLHLIGKSRAHAENCLARAIYFEARNQPYRGQVAVAQVVMNRVFSGVYPRDVCGVIYQNAHRRLACQFTFACDGKPDIITERRPWYRAERIARKTLDGKLYVQAVGTATHYHATYVHPYWVREMRRYAREGIHLFYRPRAWGNGSNEPIWSSKELAANEYYKRRR
ncbi:MAG: cell wall hydrolase [Pseudolabrys sp.]